MILAPFLISLVILNRRLNFAEYSLRNRTDRAAQRVYAVYGVEIEDAFQIFTMREMRCIQPASGHNGQGRAGGGGFMKHRPFGELIKFTQKAVHRAISDTVPVLGTILSYTPFRNVIYQFRQAVFFIALSGLQRVPDSFFMIRRILPDIRRRRVSAHRFRIGYVKHIMEALLLAVVRDQGNALRAAFHKPAQRLVPDADGRTGVSVWPLGVNHKLPAKREFVLSSGCFQKRRPVFRRLRYVFRVAVQHIGIVLQF
jgi:hypothetical protein